MFSNAKHLKANFEEYLRTHIQFATSMNLSNFPHLICLELYGTLPVGEYGTGQERLKYEEYLNLTSIYSDKYYYTAGDTNMKFQTSIVREYLMEETLKNIECWTSFGHTIYVFTNYGLLQLVSAAGLVYEMKFYETTPGHKDEVEKYINDILVLKEQKEKSPMIRICYLNSKGNFQFNSTEIKDMGCNVSENYNDDLPYERLKEVVRDDRQALVLLHGEPGTGKTTLIKQLVKDVPDVPVYYFDYRLLQSITQDSLLSFLRETANSVYIIEDCEKLFTDRSNGNPFLSSMLNLTDGILGEAFNIKFICTFNCPVSKIDKAVLRKGRLTLMYEFKKLSLEKTRLHVPEATEPMSLADIYNREDNGKSYAVKRVGF